MKPFAARYIAHRGLFDNAQAYPENTLPAFARAVEAGYGIELDVRLTKDGRLVVAHDKTLARIAGTDAAVRDLTQAELAAYPILASGETIPAFADVLALIAGRVPLIVELKPESDVIETCERTAEALADYPGPYCVESFDPRVLWWYRRHRPGVLRGQLSQDFTDDPATASRLADKLLTAMVGNLVTWPDFVAYRHTDANRFAVRFWQAVLGSTLVGWTIKSAAELADARRRFAVIIFDGFIPV